MFSELDVDGEEWEGDDDAETRDDAEDDVHSEVNTL